MLRKPPADDIGSGETLPATPVGTPAPEAAEPTRPDLGVGSTIDATAPPRPRVVRSLVGQTLDRFQLVARLGAGGMGEVYEAQDPELDRRVAIKVLPPIEGDRRAELETRLRREAQALARLEHPNVVAIYDVGVTDRHPYIVMQLVRGGTLAERLPGAAVRRILDWFVAAGRGLAAAHAAGVVHRDFKPGNVLVDDRGRVVVSDFGLARGAGDESAEPSTSTSPTSLLHDNMTGAGSVVGTPLYMAPEQHLGGAITAATDQYSFALAVWEALYRRHPFLPRNRDVAEMCAAMERDEVIEPERGHRVPARVGRALRRALRHDPAARWPGMTELLDELAPPVRRRWVWAGGAAIAVGAAVVVGIVATRDDPVATCRAEADRIQAVWPGRAAELERALGAAGLPDAAGFAGRVRTRFDERAATWRQMRRATCDAPAAADTGQASVDLQRQCLDADRRMLSDLIDTLVAAPRAGKARALDAIDALPRLGDCSAAGVVGLPAIPAGKLVEVGAIEAELRHARTLSELGDVRAALAIVDAMVPRADATGYGPVRARTRYIRAYVRLAGSIGDPGADAREAAEIAIASRAERVAALALSVAVLVATNKPDRAQVELLVPMARAAAQRTGDPEIEASMKTIIGSADAAVLGKPDEALALCGEALRWAGPAKDHKVEIQGLNCVFAAHLTRGDVPAAVEDAQRSLEVNERAYGKESLGIVAPLHNLALARRRLGEFEAALAMHQRELSIKEKILGPDSIEVADTLLSIAQMMHEAHKADAGIPLAARALAIAEKVDVPPSQTTFGALVTTAQLLRLAERRKEALAHYERALALGEKLFAADDQRMATAHFSYGNALAEAGDTQRALEHFARAETALEAAGSPRAAVVQLARGDILESQGKCAEAVPLYAAAVETLERAKVDAFNALIGKLSLADCRYRANLDRAGARVLVQEVRAAAAARGEGGKQLVREADQWLRKHR